MRQVREDLLTSRRKPVADLQAFGETEFLQLSDATLEDRDLLVRLVGQ